MIKHRSSGLTVLAALASGPPIGSVAPAFSARTTEGRSLSLEDLRGKVVVLSFFATWCESCHETSAQVQVLHERLRERTDVAVLGVHYDAEYGRWSSPRAYLDAKHHSYEVIPDGTAIVAAYDVGSVPAIVVVDPNGVVLFRRGSMDASDVAELERLIKAHLGAKS